MEYSRCLLMMMTVVMCAVGVFANPMLCIDDDFDDGKSVLFDFDKEGVKIIKYEENTVDLDKPEDSNEYVAFFKSSSYTSKPIFVTKGSQIKFLHKIKNGFKDGSVDIKVYDEKDNSESITIKQDYLWKEASLEWNYDTAHIQITITCKAKLPDFFFALDHINILIEEDDKNCPLPTPSSSKDPELCPTSSTPIPEECKNTEELEEDLQFWKIMMIAGWSVAGVAVISTITLAVLLAKKANSKTDSVDQNWPKTNYPTSYDYSTVGSAGLPRLQPKPRRY